VTLVGLALVVGVMEIPLATMVGVVLVVKLVILDGVLVETFQRALEEEINLRLRMII
jgi:hypothetical protein